MDFISYHKMWFNGYKGEFENIKVERSKVRSH